MKFSAGVFGVETTDSLFLAGAFEVRGWAPVSVERRPGQSFEVDDCEFVMPSDLFRLVYERPDSLVAGCFGDFDGDSIRDYALLLRNRSTQAVEAYAFLQRPGGFQSLPLGPVSDRYGFDEDPSFPPGPFRVGKPWSYYVSSGEAPPDSVLPNCDYIQVGWQTYYWDREKFVALWTSD